LSLLLRLSLLWAAPAGALESTESSDTLQIWYRSSDGCPDGSAFVLRLNQLGRPARLASVGDRVDFVVTVAHDVEQSSGRLERQTELGTMAIREISADRCDQVVEGLALSLDLALGPVVEKPTSAAVDQRGDAAWRLSFGAGPTLATALAPQAMLGASVYAALSHRAGAGVILTAHGARESGTQGGQDLTISLLEARAAGCPLALSHGAWMIQPCLGLSAGWMGADVPAPRGHSDDAFWASGVAFARGGWHATEVLGLYLDLGALVPLVRYEFGAPTGAAIFSTGSVGFEAGLGITWWLP
jgi:hypothetical protein